MNEKIFESYSFKEKEEKLIEVSKEYFKNVQKLIKNNDISLKSISTNPREFPVIDLSNISSKFVSKEVKFVFCVNFAIASLTRQESTILNNDFFFPKDKKWWMGIYSQSSYYRFKARAVNKFLEVLDI